MGKYNLGKVKPKSVRPAALSLSLRDMQGDRRGLLLALVAFEAMFGDPWNCLNRGNLSVCRSVLSGFPQGGGSRRWGCHEYLPARPEFAQAPEQP